MAAVPVAELVSRVPSWAGRTVDWGQMPGGLSHQIYRVDVDGTPYVLRVLDPAVSAAGLGIPPDQEIANTVRAARSGAGPAVLEVLPDVPALVLEFLPGRTFGQDDVRDDRWIPGIADACRRLHAGPRFVNDFDIFDRRELLLGLCAEHDLPLPARYLDRSVDVQRMRTALAAAPPPSAPCHNDLLPENFIGDGHGVRIVDYQLSGNNDPTFELGDIAAEADYDPDRVERLAAAYFGAGLTPALLARVRLNLTASNVTWALWFTVHHGLLRGPDVDFAYDQEAADKWAQAQRDLDSPDFGRLLDAVVVISHPSPP